MKIDYPLEITTFADIPANTGLGSSSAFTVGLLKALYGLRGEMIGKYELAQQAATIEVDILKRNMGKQDHFASAYGGVNIFNFYSDERVEVCPVILHPKGAEALENGLLLFYTKLKRDASEILSEQNTNIEDIRDTLKKMQLLVPVLYEVLVNGDKMPFIGKILEDSWLLKKRVSNSISSAEIDHYYQIAKTAGALGGKILGAGGGGFLLFYVENHCQMRVIEALKSLYCLKIKIDFNGSSISYYDSSDAHF
jgi:D-glycero-alpha-D-manno-heptose-7-phosphate kinase